MVQSTLTCYGHSVFSRSVHDDIYLRQSLTPEDNYRCPVSTPTNHVTGHNDLRRSKTLHVIDMKYPTSGNERHRSGRLKRGRNKAKYTPQAAITGLQYHATGMKVDTTQTQQGHWLRSLCAQPVEEILNKYRRKSDFIRTHKLWLHTFTTPGEKSLLNAWSTHHHSHNHDMISSVGHLGSKLNGITI